jgi:uncharacterized protein
MEVMKKAVLRFYEELNDYLPEDKKKRDFVCVFDGKPSVGDLLKAVGVPSSEVDLVLCNSESISLAHILQDGDRLSVYPIFELFDIQGSTCVRESPLKRTRQQNPAVGPTSAFPVPGS